MSAAREAERSPERKRQRTRAWTSPLDRSEVLRLLQQTLHDLQYPKVAASLEAASGVPLENAAVAQLRSQVQLGAWEEAAATLERVPIPLASRQKGAFVLFQQQLLEAVERCDHASALKCLRTRLQPLCAADRAEQLHQLAACLFCTDLSEIQRVVEWPGTGAEARQSALKQIQEIVPPQLMLPQGRLLTLLEQALHAQTADTLLHNAARPNMSLLSAYRPGLGQVPTRPTQMVPIPAMLMAFSPNGRILACADTDGDATLHSVSEACTLTEVYTWTPHDGAITALQWSADGMLLATGGAGDSDQCVRIWRPDGTAAGHSSAHVGGIIALAWLPDRRLLACSQDESMCLLLADGTFKHRWKVGSALAMSTSPDGRWLLASYSDKLSLFDLQTLLSPPLLTPQTTTITHGLACSVELAHVVDNVAWASDSLHFLASSPDRLPQLFALELVRAQHGCGESGAERTVCAAITLSVRYAPGGTGAAPAMSDTFCVFGGLDQAFVVGGVGGEGVQVWHRATGQPLYSLSVDLDQMICVVWSPACPHLMVSATDTQMCVWTSPCVNAGPVAEDFVVSPFTAEPSFCTLAPHLVSRFAASATL